MNNLISIRKNKHESFLQYCEELPYPSEIKERILHFFRNETLKAENIYLVYPMFFIDDSHYPELVDHICFASFFFYNAINVKDLLYDRKNLGKDQKHRVTFLSGICQEEGVKLLASIFELSHPFWTTWNLRRYEFLGSLQLDQQYKTQKTIPWDVYMELSDRKMAFAKIAVDIWHHLFPDKLDAQMQDIINRSQRHVNICFQIVDDIFDMKEDLQNDQANIAVSEVISFLATNKRKIDDLTYEEVSKVFYMEGIARDLYHKALQHLDKSKEILGKSSAKVPLWIELINTKELEIKSNLANMETVFRRWTVLSTLSNSIKKSNNIGTALNDSLQYIKTRQRDDGSWADCVTNTLISDVWVTGYIVHQLPAREDNTLMTRACDFLNTHRQNDCLWGFNTNWIVDADSTTCALMALSHRGYDVAREYSCWLKYQLPSGGFTTYIDDQALHGSLEFINDFKGWTQEHTCVSALAYKFLCQYDPESESVRKLEKYLLDQWDKNLWKAYWWTSPVYNTALLLETLVEHDRGNADKVLSIASELTSFIDQEAHVVRDLTGKKNFFFTAMVVGALCSSKELYQAHESIIDRVVTNLLNHQYEDGSFPTSHFLRIPGTEVIDPGSVAKWTLDPRKDNVITSDFARLFTTTNCHRALHRYNSIKNHRV
jgi:hypothetical protein